jgi:pyrroline-5-carboxylate reductase
MLFMDAYIKSLVRLGLSEETARGLVFDTVSGTVEVCKADGGSIGDLINAVCSKGGTTIEAVKIFNERRLADIIDEAVTACYNKSVKLAKE